MTDMFMKLVGPNWRELIQEVDGPGGTVRIPVEGRKTDHFGPVPHTRVRKTP
jgi:hypothetical protein